MIRSMNRGANNAARRRVGEWLGEAGIRIDGECPWDLRVHREDFFTRVLAEGSLGFGDSYVEGWWDCEAIDQMVERIWRARLPRRVRVWRDLPRILRSKWFNLQRGRRAFHVGHHHYDIGNGLYGAMLDARMIYSCGYWARAETLEEAQEAKLELIFRKLQLAPGMRVLDIDELSEREWHVLRWVLRGLLNKQIADELGIAERTVKYHRTALTQKLGVNSAAELGALAREAGVTEVGAAASAPSN
jgi:DNA-binding CsgD family transcriptional regulator